MKNTQLVGWGQDRATEEMTIETLALVSKLYAKLGSWDCEWPGTGIKKGFTSGPPPTYMDNLNNQASTIQLFRDSEHISILKTGRISKGQLMVESKCSEINCNWPWTTGNWKTHFVQRICTLWGSYTVGSKSWARVAWLWGVDRHRKKEDTHIEDLILPMVSLEDKL